VGLAPVIRKRVAEGISELRAKGITTLTTASDMSYVPDIANIIYRLDRGEMVERQEKG
jgi:ABC-type polar amino acid transport system ATPase subunit